MDSKSQKAKAYQFIKEILMQAQDLDKSDQLKFVESSCKDCPEHIPALLKMLNIGDSEMIDVLDKPAILSHSPDLESEEDELELPAGYKISHYEIIEKIGSGGMGNVYSAQQEYPAQRVVALKLIKKVPKQKLILSETQILARLNHPNIATLFEIDQFDQQQFFIAMEMIQGEDYIHWCRNNNYTQKQTIELFQQLCSGISYAHEQGIIHCDIKPSNVLVTQIDGIDTVKIIDFGISQFNETQESSLEISGTPAYLAPEVLNSKGQIKTEISRDIFAMGVLLDKTLSDERNADIQAVIKKATAQDPAQRYSSVIDFNKDFTRFLKKQTVSARDNSLWHKSKLLVQRRIAVVLVMALILIISLFSAYLAQYKQAEIATQQAQAAKTAQTEAEELSAFLTDLFNVANPERSNTDIVSAVDLIDKAKDKLMAIEEPTLSDARFMHTIGSIYTRMDKLEQAKIMIVHSLAIKNQFLKNDDNEINAALIQLGVIHKNLREFSESEQNLLKALDSLNTQDNPDESQKAYVHNHLGNLYMLMEEVDQSISHHELAIKYRKNERNNKLLADSYNNLGVIYRKTKKWDFSSKYLNLALNQYLKHYDSNHPYIGIAKSNLAYIEEQRFNWDDSEMLMLEVWDNWKDSYGLEHINTINIQKNLALYYDRRMQYTKAVGWYDGLIKHFKSIDNTEQEAKYSDLKALTLSRDGHYLESINLHEYSLNLYLQSNKKEKYLQEKILNQYATSLILKGDFSEAENLIKKSLSLFDEKYKPSNSSRLYTLNFLADLHYQSNDFEKSIETYNKVIENENTQVSNQRQQITALIGLAKNYQALADPLKAQTLLSKALNSNQNIYGEIHKDNAIIYYELAKVEQSLNRTLKSKEWANKAIEIQIMALPDQHKDLLATKKLVNSFK